MQPGSTNFRSAIELVIACTRPGAGIGDEVIEALLGREIDWERVVRVALLHGVSPLLARRLARLRSPGVPAEILAALEQHLADVRERNGLLTRALLQVLDGLQERGVLALPFKGQALGAIAFGDATLRRANDVDILLRRRDVAAAVEVLEALGYRELVEFEYGHRLSPLAHAESLRYQCEYGFVRVADNIVVQPHWAIVPRALAVDLDYDEFWDRAAPVNLDGRDTPTLGLTDLLHVLCVHACKHEWTRLQWTCDVAALIERNPQLDVAAAVAGARERGFERMVLVGLGLAQRVYGTVLEPGVQARLSADASAVRLVATFAGGLLGGNLPDPSTPSSTRVRRLRLAMRESRKDRVDYVVRTVLSPTPELLRLAPLPAGLRVLYPPLRIAYAGARSAWRLLRAAARWPRMAPGG